MITIFGDFRRFSAKCVNGVFLKNLCCELNFAKTGSILNKKRTKIYFLNHKIGPPDYEHALCTMYVHMGANR
jgi:hypothetical protein